MHTELIIDDAVILSVRATKERLAQECDYDPRKLAQAISQRGNDLSDRFGLKVRQLDTISK